VNLSWITPKSTHPQNFFCAASVKPSLTIGPLEDAGNPFCRSPQSAVLDVWGKIVFDSLGVDCGVSRGVRSSPSIFADEEVTAPFISPLCPWEAVGDEFS
jgi:hypothetical protein